MPVFKNVVDGNIFFGITDDSGKEVVKIVKPDGSVDLSEKEYEGIKENIFFVNGHLVLIEKDIEEIKKKTKTNALTNKQIDELLKNKVEDVIEALKEIDSPVTLNRIKKKSKSKRVISFIAQVQRELNIKCGGDHRIKPVELSSVDEAVKQEAIGSLAR